MQPGGAQPGGSPAPMGGSVHPFLRLVQSKGESPARTGPRTPVEQPQAAGAPAGVRVVSKETLQTLLPQRKVKFGLSWWCVLPAVTYVLLAGFWEYRHLPGIEHGVVTPALGASILRVSIGLFAPIVIAWVCFYVFARSRGAASAIHATLCSLGALGAGALVVAGPMFEEALKRQAGDMRLMFEQKFVNPYAAGGEDAGDGSTSSGADAVGYRDARRVVQQELRGQFDAMTARLNSLESRFNVLGGSEPETLKDASELDARIELLAQAEEQSHKLTTWLREVERQSTEHLARRGMERSRAAVAGLEIANALQIDWNIRVNETRQREQQAHTARLKFLRAEASAWRLDPNKGIQFRTVDQSRAYSALNQKLASAQARYSELKATSSLPRTAGAVEGE